MNLFKIFNVQKIHLSMKIYFKAEYRQLGCIKYWIDTSSKGVPHQKFFFKFPLIAVLFVIHKIFKKQVKQVIHRLSVSNSWKAIPDMKQQTPSPNFCLYLKCVDIVSNWHFGRINEQHVSKPIPKFYLIVVKSVQLKYPLSTPKPLFQGPKLQ